MRRRRVLWWSVGTALGLALGAYAWAWLTYPSDRTPEGAYLRVMAAVNSNSAKAYFAYTETEAQHACFTIGKYRRESKERVLSAYPEAERASVLEGLEPFATHSDGPEVFAAYAARKGWLEALRRDMSGIDHVEIQGERATVETVRGTRYPFRRRDNGIWGLTLYTAFLVAEAERAARDAKWIDQAADDYARAAERQ